MAVRRIMPYVVLPTADLAAARFDRAEAIIEHDGAAAGSLLTCPVVPSSDAGASPGS